MQAFLKCYPLEVIDESGGDIDRYFSYAEKTLSFLKDINFINVNPVWDELIKNTIENYRTYIMTQNSQILKTYNDKLKNYEKLLKKVTPLTQYNELPKICRLRKRKVKIEANTQKSDKAEQSFAAKKEEGISPTTQKHPVVQKVDSKASLLPAKEHQVLKSANEKTDSLMQRSVDATVSMSKQVIESLTDKSEAIKKGTISQVEIKRVSDEAHQHILSTQKELGATTAITNRVQSVHVIKEQTDLMTSSACIAEKPEKQSIMQSSLKKGRISKEEFEATMKLTNELVISSYTLIQNTLPFLPDDSKEHLYNLQSQRVGEETLKCYGNLWHKKELIVPSEKEVLQTVVNTMK